MRKGGLENMTLTRYIEDLKEKASNQPTGLGWMDDKVVRGIDKGQNLLTARNNGKLWKAIIDQVLKGRVIW